MSTILVTGITGTVMNPLSARLLKAGHSVVALVRPAHGTSPEQRLKDALQVDKKTSARLSVIPGDITQNLTGISAEDISRWHGKIDRVLHGAASIKFDETPTGEVHKTNVFGTKQTLRLAELLAIPEFHYVSTAYVAGDAEEFWEKDNGMNQHHRNSYEHSKAMAETLVREFYGDISIYRIPIVVGDSQTGEISSFHGYYGFLAPFWKLKHSLMKKWKEDPNYGKQDGIFLHKQKNVHIPLFIPCSQTGPLNLVPIDWLTDMLIELILQPAKNKIFHLTHPNPRGIRETMKMSFEHLGFTGITYGKNLNNNQTGLAKRIQQTSLKWGKLYESCTLKDREVFHNEQTMEALGSHWRMPPDINSEMLKRLLEFAKAHNFGALNGE